MMSFGDEIPFHCQRVDQLAVSETKRGVDVEKGANDGAGRFFGEKAFSLCGHPTQSAVGALGLSSV